MGGVGAVCTNCANGVTSGMLERRTAAGRAATFGGDGPPFGDDAVDASFDLVPKYPKSSEPEDVMPSLA